MTAQQSQQPSQPAAPPTVKAEVAPFQLAPPNASPNGVGEILRIAVERGVDVGSLERLVALHERMSERQAAVEFNQALAAFQAECPSIEKTSSASIGGQYSYKYAQLDEIARTTRPLLQRHGLSYSWDSDVQNDRLVCVCTVRHIGGHSQSAKFTTPTQSPSTRMSLQQQQGAALTYARRQSLVQALGLTMTDEDNDAAMPPPVNRQTGEIRTPPAQPPPAAKPAAAPAAKPVAHDEPDKMVARIKVDALPKLVAQQDGSVVVWGVPVTAKTWTEWPKWRGYAIYEGPAKEKTKSALKEYSWDKAADGSAGGRREMALRWQVAKAQDEIAAGNLGKDGKPWLSAQRNVRTLYEMLSRRMGDGPGTNDQEEPEPNWGDAVPFP